MNICSDSSADFLENTSNEHDSLAMAAVAYEIIKKSEAGEMGLQYLFWDLYDREGVEARLLRFCKEVDKAMSLHLYVRDDNPRVLCLGKCRIMKSRIEYLHAVYLRLSYQLKLVIGVTLSMELLARFERVGHELYYFQKY